MSSFQLKEKRLHNLKSKERKLIFIFKFLHVKIVLR